MHHALFTNQRHLEQTDLDSYAKDLGIEVSRFHADIQASATADRIAKDKKLGEDLQIGGTPTIFINGRLFDGRQDINEWITLELANASADAGAAPAASAADAGKAMPVASGAASAKPTATDAGTKK
jgi:protein-disulfide isomerase